jgi:amidohydrolase
VEKNWNLKEEQALRAQIESEIEAHRSQLTELSLKIHDNPELGFCEVKASAWLEDYLEENGFKVERGICQLPTAFKASYGSGKPNIAFLAEYDALPSLGHGCGHNIIAASAVGAGIAIREIARKAGGTIMVIGTPAEEIEGAKIAMLEKGAFDWVDVAMMVHPGTQNIAVIHSLACAGLEVEFFGKPAHAAVHPEQGINALEAMLQAFNGINSLRQHVKETSRIHGVIIHGGEAANIVPDYTSGKFLVRAEDADYLDELKERVLNCFTAASLSTGARLEHRWSRMRYAPMRNNFTLAGVFMRNLESLGRRVYPPSSSYGFGSTDMGNVSQVVPSIHPIVSIASPETSEHTREFAAAAASEAGHRGLIDAAKAMALTAAELLADPQLLLEVKGEFQEGDSGGKTWHE